MYTIWTEEARIDSGIDSKYIHNQHFENSHFIQKIHVDIIWNLLSMANKIQ